MPVTNTLTSALRRSMEPLGARNVRHLDLGDPPPAVAPVYAQVRQDFLIGPPVALHEPAPDLLAGAWCALRESLVAGPVPRTDKEIVATAVANANNCPFCTEAHGSMVGSGLGLAKAGALEDRPGRTGALAVWAGASRTPGSAALREPPFPITEAPQIIGTAVIFHYINRMVNVFCSKSALPGPMNHALVRPLTERAMPVILRATMPRNLEPGRSLGLLPATDPPADLSWATPSAPVAGAFARLATAVKDGGKRALPDRVREVVREEIDAWRGEDPPLGRTWMSGALDQLPTSQHPCARLALMVAFAAYRVDDGVVADFRQVTPDDRSLVHRPLNP